MGNRLSRLIGRSLRTPVTPLAYLIIANSLFFGVGTIMFDSSESVRMTVIQKVGIWEGFPVWGWLMVISSVLLFVGMIDKSVIRTKTGAVLGFFGWMFVFVVYLEFQYWFQMGLSLMSTMAYAYLFLAVNVGRLWDYTPADDRML